MTPAIEARLQAICDRHAQLVAQLGQLDASSMGHAEMALANKELADLEPVVEAVGELRAKRREVSRRWRRRALGFRA